MRILGVDPGTATTGWGVVDLNDNQLDVCDFGLIETEKNNLAGKRLININQQVKNLIKATKPDVVAIEKLFFATNAKTAMSVGQAIGVIIFTVASMKVDIYEYAPGTIKKVIAGNGRADKKEMQKSIRKILGAKVRSRVNKKTHFDNSADALAVAVCYAYNINNKVIKGGEK